MEHLFDQKPDCPGFRLHRLELFNWGTFDSTDGQVYRFEPAGRTSLLVGHNGSGKSTLVDAILTLLVEPRTRNYNVAAGAKKTERTEKSYICGAYARTSDADNSAVVQLLRPKPTNVTALLAVFRDEQLDKAFTLCQIRHLTSDGSADKLYAIIDEMRDLKTDLQGINSSNCVREHLEQLGYETTKKFIQYHAALTKRTKMRGKATDLFNQTVAVKDIQSLNEFIRSHMLEAQNWREKVALLLRHFYDLSAAHGELVRARKADQLLQPVEKCGLKYRRRLAELEAGQRNLEAAKTFFQVETLRLFEPVIKQNKDRLSVSQATLQRYAERQKAIAESQRQLKNEIDQAGGNRLRAIPRLIELQQAKLQPKRIAFDRYHDLLKQCEINDIVGSSRDFTKIRSLVLQKAKAISARLDSATFDYENYVARRGELRNQLRIEHNELEALGKRQTNLSIRLTTLRNQICADLHLTEETLPFVAELIAVKPDERRWESSAELVLRHLALSLLVPEKHYRKVLTYIEQTQLTDVAGQGQKLDYICISKPFKEANDRPHADSLIHKLNFRTTHELSSWVRSEILRRYDFRCCDNIEQFSETPGLAMTDNRHVKINGQHHKKDDRQRTIDPRYFVLGWDNREKKQRIATYIKTISDQLASLDDDVDRQANELEQLRLIRQATEEVLELTDFGLIDVKTHLTEISALEEELHQLEHSNNVVKTLKEKLAEVETESDSLQQSRDQQSRTIALLQKDIEEGEKLIAEATTNIAEAKSSHVYATHAEAFDAIGASLGQTLSADNLFQCKQKWGSSTRQLVQSLRDSLQGLAEKLIESMGRYLREFKEEQSDLNASIQSLDSFFELLDQIRLEDLPRHEKKFKDRLNDKVSHEVALFHGALRKEQKQIEDKISQLNRALGKLEYRPGTFMCLEPRSVQDREIDDFRRSLRECLDESFDSSDQANEERFLRIQKLVERLGDSEKTRWRDKVIDVRNWYNFAAREIEKETGETRSFHEGSSGQSGGEKAKLAFTILVAAIAYQFDIDPEKQAPGRFQFVVVDEMLSKIDDQNAKYALKLFAQFGLQLLIVAPLDAKARVTEPFVDHYLHVVKNETTNHSQLYSMTAREYEEVVKQFAGNGHPKGRRRLTAK